MQNRLTKLASYNEWAWQRVFASVAQLDVDAYKLDRGFFWGSIHGMLTHCFSAEWIWPLRIQGQSPSALLDPDDFATFGDLRAAWDPARQALRDFVAGLSDADLARTYRFSNTRGVAFEATVADSVQHIFVHSAEHRGQVTPVLYQLGVPTEPLDYIFFARRRLDGL